MKNIETEEQWSKKRILIAFVIVTFLLGTGIYFLKDIPSKAIQGAKTEKENISTQEAQDHFIPVDAVIKERLDILKKEVANLSVEDIASSSPQIQKIINDFNSLKQYPVNEIKNICRQICGL